ncbi:nucleoside diphosphate kinase 6 isoform X2 [Peromyscus eremicus]|uniref:nucleoside diphosphate kinase 6 isoform X2 n=1 Tax=Peromyscus eremicus TaxID=42410 RepID=UPI0027DE6641|nr:nucleoside diphosphate kinase 6 isoform X2 [Peromyscus eremicus]
MTSILRSPQALQLTLALIKPDAVAHPLILEAVHQQILSNKFLIVRMRELQWKREDCRRFYREHEGEWSNQSLHPCPQRCHPALENTDGTHQSISSTPHGPRFNSWEFGPH